MVISSSLLSWVRGWDGRACPDHFAGLAGGRCGGNQLHVFFGHDRACRFPLVRFCAPRLDRSPVG